MSATIVVEAVRSRMARAPSGTFLRKYFKPGLDIEWLSRGGQCAVILSVPVLVSQKKKSPNSSGLITAGSYLTWLDTALYKINERRNAFYKLLRFAGSSSL